jgi:hypothetical protein
MNRWSTCCMRSWEYHAFPVCQKNIYHMYWMGLKRRSFSCQNALYEGIRRLALLFYRELFLCKESIFVGIHACLQLYSGLDSDVFRQSDYSDVSVLVRVKILKKPKLLVLPAGKKTLTGNESGQVLFNCSCHQR